MTHELEGRLDERTARTAVVGLGYVGLSPVEALHDAGLSITGFDGDSAKGESPSRGLILGAAYEPGTGDTREPPAIEIMDLLEERSAQLECHDPFVPQRPETRHHEVDVDPVDLTDSGRSRP